MNESANEQIRVRTVLMRGGSSKAVFLNENHVPSDTATRTRFLLALFGSPDKRQIDGLGGSDYLTSKCAIMGPPSRPDADVDYTFVQVSVENPVVSYDIACGNITTAAGLYAVEEGYVRARSPATVVRVHNTNTRKVLKITVPVQNGIPRVEGDFAIDGVPGTGAKIDLDFSDTAGAVTGKTLPTGNVRDRIESRILGRSLEVTIVDVANPCVFIPAESLGLTGAEQPGTIPDRLLDALEEIRAQSARIAGIKSYLLPFQVIVGPAQEYANYLTRQPVSPKIMDLTARLFVERVMHKAYAGTGATCLGVAARIPGTVVHAQCPGVDPQAPLRIGHPSGMLPIVADVSPKDGGWVVNEVVFSRTARRIMEGWAYVRKARLAESVYCESHEAQGERAVHAG
jgi:2-methylaconitate cis-trans-isomerase PrpF